MPDLRQPIKSALTAVASGPLREAAKNLLGTLGYQSDRTLNLEGSKPQAFLDLIASQGGQNKFDETKALFPDWKSADILFQLSDSDISRERSLFKDTTVQPGLLQSYLFFAIELKGKDYALGKLTGIARQINRVFPMPVMLLIRHGDASGAPVLSIAVINRRRNKVHAEKDVLEKVTLIRDVSLTDPHRGHLDILASFAVENLVHPKKIPIQDFDTLHAAWEQIFNVELLNARFYKELANWYFWALPQVEFPADLEPDEEKRNATGLIRLLTRLIFCWFLKEKNLIPEKLFHATDLAKILKGFDPESETSSTYYQAILQNLFFATLNQRMGKDGNGKPYRLFATDEGFAKNRATYDVNNLYRYEALFRDEPDAALAHFADIPFLNGGLFECLDRTEDGTDKKRYLDGFSRNAKKRPHVPDRLFFDSGETADLSTAYGDTKRRAEKVTGLITILNRYKFTIVENTPIDQEIALDPELLGKVFENLLASYNEETKTTARKQTGSFYTPRPIVDYMVDESLKAHLTRALVEKARMKEPDARAGLDLLFAYTEKEHAFTPAEVATLIAAIDALKILDPACGSGAFPMGVLHKLVYILGKLDPDNDRWKQTQLAKLDSAPMREELERAFTDNNDDYGRKLYLIENCLYGVDIQPIAIQITKLRFFISLVCDQKTNRNKKDNHGIRPLPNLETKFVAANTLIGLPEMDQMELVDPRVYKIEAEIETLYHNHFSIQRRDQKLAVQGKVKALRNEMADLLAQSLMSRKKSEHIAEWDPFDPQSSADFFDPHWMFGRSLANGFDIIIGNPPYGVRFTVEQKAYFKKSFETIVGKYDSYGFFFERAFRLSNPFGITCYITPHTWLSVTEARTLRQFVLGRLKVVSIVVLKEQVFGAAVVDTAISLIQNAKANVDHEYPVARPEENDFANISSKLVNQNVQRGTPGVLMLKAENEISQAILDKIYSHSDRLEGFCKMCVGVQAYDSYVGQEKSIIENRAFHSEYQKNKTFRRELSGREVSRYWSNWTKNAWLSYGDWLAHPRDPWFFEGVRIVVREITGNHPNRIMATIIEEDYVTYKTVLNLKIEDSEAGGAWSHLALVGLLNSTLFSWVFGLIANKQEKKVFPRISLFDLKRLPIVKSPNRNLIKKISDLATRQLKFANSNQSSDPDIDAEIDQQVYALYGLTPEEIAIVEGGAK
jgi:type I restriction-modification system DNA methylase subunit/uncharacterized short protein YbdD (DUF466 family)